MEKLTSLRTQAEDADVPEDAGPLLAEWVRDVLSGLSTALASLLAAGVLTMLGWLLSANAGSSPVDALAAAAVVWFLAHGGSVVLGPATIALSPLLLSAAALWWAVSRARATIATADPHGPTVAGVPRAVLEVSARWWSGYAAGAGFVASICAFGPATPRIAGMFVAATVIPVLAVVLAWTRIEGSDGQSIALGIEAPEVVRRALGPAVRGVFALAVVSLIAVLIALALRFDVVRALHDQTGAGSLTASAPLIAVQAAVLPNLLLWVCGVFAGPGFSPVAGAHTTLTETSGGLLPLVPVLGAAPPPGERSALLWLGMVVPVLIGAWIGRRVLANVARLSAARTKLSVAVMAAVLTAVMVGAIDVFAGGSLGAYRLSEVGTPAGWLTVTLGLELVLGAAATALVDAWRLRR